MPLYGADFNDPNTGYANPNGVVMWYHEVTAGKPHVFPDNLPAVITETTFRDPKQPVIAPDMPPSQIQLIDNYDVSYVDTLGLPASMEATLVPSTPATPGSGQYAWTGADQSTTDMQQSVANFTTNNTSVQSQVSTASARILAASAGTSSTCRPTTTRPRAARSHQINNNLDSNQQPTVPVTIITNASTAGLVNGAAVTISGVTGGQTNDQRHLDHQQRQPAGNSFALVGISGDGSHDLPAAAPVTAVSTTGIHVQKLAAGSDAMTLSPNVNSPSPFDSTKFNLVSGGTVYNIDTTEHRPCDRG